ncbi:hypothetical protein HMPREF3190_00223 [Umbribacter vaginalis]|nr:hypothetical protein HMPREF3190_00223 [Coriobacteriales bacterium DNF00809]
MCADILLSLCGSCAGALRALVFTRSIVGMKILPSVCLLPVFRTARLRLRERICYVCKS